MSNFDIYYYAENGNESCEYVEGMSLDAAIKHASARVNEYMDLDGFVVRAEGTENERGIYSSGEELYSSCEAE